MDLRLLKKYFGKQGHKLEIKYFHEIDFRKDNFKNIPVLYQSSEDPGLKYKDYLEDVLTGLLYQGAILIPDFFKFRSHHNKVFMEMYRDLGNFSEIKKIKSKSFGTLESCLNYSNKISFPAILKPAGGSRSRGVKLVKNKKQLEVKAKSISSSPTVSNIRRYLENLIYKNGYKKTSHNRKKFISQNFIPNLKGDYKILVYSDKYYVLHRKNRNNDFRASGSGKLSFPESPPKELLDYAEKVFKYFNVPFISIDIAEAEGVYYLLEFQFLSFGQYALEKSKFYWNKKNGKWNKIEEMTVLEEQFAKSISKYINKK
ncbi:MAG: hypothetical protein KKA61_02850 [Nanoarchaeota archaeon]|nr:hypothetical protein [Nanoarchaeota archaeon]